MAIPLYTQYYTTKLYYTNIIIIGLLYPFTTDKWTPQHLIATGDKPPALYRHTLTKIGKRRVAMFGGCDGSVRRNDTYILDVESWV